MSDFAQTGLITTLQRLNDHHVGTLEAALAASAAEHPIALVLPCHARELDSLALAHIVRELSGATWIAEVIVSMNGLDAASYARAEALFASLPQQTRVLWNDRTPAPNGQPAGKGANVAAAFALLAREGRAALVATQDCDVATFRRSDLARLCYPVAR